MCGIVGYVSTARDLDAERFTRMRDSLAHRGPDDQGLVGWDASGKRSDDAPAFRYALGHRRLSIIDLSAEGHQPMSDAAGRDWIAYNGECYNFGDYREELEEAGRVFRSQSDTEVLLHLVGEYGLERALACVNGMFAFAFWDSREQELFLARDRMGQKPLYYARLDDGGLVFASEIKALLESGLIDTKDIDPVALDQFWALGYIPAPRTIYAGIRQLPPGHLIRWRDGRFEQSPWWPLPQWGREPYDAPLDELCDELETLLSDAVRLRLIADVPVGLFLSGGIDSALICALAKDVAGERIQTCTIAFEEASHDESHHARAVAKHLGLDNTVLTADGSMFGDFDALVRQFDQPFGDLSAIPTWLVCKLAREHVTVALSGDAGDELFGGYDDYRQGMRLWGAGARRSAFPGPASLRERLAEFKYRGKGAQRGFAEWAQRLSEPHRRKLYADPALARADSLAPRLAAGSNAVRDALCVMQAMDLGTYLCDDILAKVDRMSMMVSLECRAPLLDFRVVEFAARLPYEAKMDEQGRGKRILRELLSRYLPRELFERPKAGFTPPWEQWCAGPLRQELRAGWRSIDRFNPDAADFLLPESGELNPVLAWNAYSAVRFFG